MPLVSEERDMTLATPWGMFNYRVAFLFFRDQKILLHKSTNGYWYIPGGRVTFGEASLAAVQREIEEELQTKAEKLELGGIVENFFQLEGKPFHEIMLVYRAEFAEEIVIPTIDHKGRPVISAWFSKEELSSVDLKPSFMKENAFGFSSGVKHVIHNDITLKRQ